MNKIKCLLTMLSRQSSSERVKSSTSIVCKPRTPLIGGFAPFAPRNEGLQSYPPFRPLHDSTSPQCNGKMKNETKTPHRVPSLNILLSNGRFPVAIDLARQLKQAGHTVFVVDPMQFHACKVSNVVNKSFLVNAPRDNAAGYIAAVKNTVKTEQIDLIIPLHEEIFHLAECEDREILDRLFAPPFGALIRLHDKWEFNRFLKRLGLDYPQAYLCRNMEDVRMLDLGKEWALKPVFGRAAGNIFHLKPEEPLPTGFVISPQVAKRLCFQRNNSMIRVVENINEVELQLAGDAPNFLEAFTNKMVITEDVHYTAQEWLYGSRYCSYSIVFDGQLRSLAIYPVKDTLDDSSCVYFESIEHPGIRAYVEKIVAAHPGVTGQLAFDFVETNDGRLVAIECNPRATSGIHLYSGTPDLARCITQPELCSNSLLVPRKGAHRQFLPGMMIVPWRSHANFSGYLSHLKRFWTSQDIIFSTRDVLPLPVVLMQPLFLSCLGFCQGKDGTSVPEMFQEDLLWEPVGKDLERVRRMLKDMSTSEENLPQVGNGRADVRMDLHAEVARRCSV